MLGNSCDGGTENYCLPQFLFSSFVFVLLENKNSPGVQPKLATACLACKKTTSAEHALASFANRSMCFSARASRELR